jgi:hypothetical protein
MVSVHGQLVPLGLSKGRNIRAEGIAMEGDHLIVVRKQRGEIERWDREEKSGDKVYPSKACRSDPLPLAKSYLLIVHLAINSLIY